MNTSNWPHGTDMGGPNWTLRTPRKSKYDGVGGWAKDSSRPPWGWCTAIALGLAAFGLLFFGPGMAARWLM